jgi:hypothetical protein
MYGMCI